MSLLFGIFRGCTFVENYLDCQLMDEAKMNEIWRGACGELSLSMTPAAYQSWIANCFISSMLMVDEERMVIELATPTGMHQRYIEERYYMLIKRSLENQVKRKVELALIIKQKEREKESSGPLFEGKDNNVVEIDQESVGRESGLNVRFTFESLVVGKANELAFAASKAIVDSPGIRNNPLFIWGGVGVGKTHLMHAIGWEMVRKGFRKIKVITSEQFTNELVAGIRNRNTESFKKKYRDVDALLIDDIQFLAGRETTQEEFFHTFNDLYGKQKQIIMTSDRRPQEIMDVEQRLISRFLGGMLVDVGLPDFEMRKAILEQKARDENILIDPAAMDMLAHGVKTNARELEGMFKVLTSLASIRGGVVTSELVREQLRMPDDKILKVRLRPQQVISTVAKHYNLKNKDLLGSSRKADLVKVRHITMYILREEMGLQLQKVAELMGGRDHTTIMHGVEKIKRELLIDQQIREQLTEVKHALGNV